MSVDIAEILKVVHAAEQIDFGAVLAAFESKDPTQMLGVLEQITGIAADLGVPYANDAKIAEIILGFVIQGYQTGLIRSAEPTDPAMERAAGRQTGTPTMHGDVPIAPGGTPEDPYGFDTR